MSTNDENNSTEYQMIEARHFNTLDFKSKSVIKYSPYYILDGEVYWYKNMPIKVQKYFPTLTNYKIQFDNTCFIVLERLKGPTLSHLYTNLSMNHHTLCEHFKLLDKIHDCESGEDFEIDIMQNYIPKIMNRCEVSHDIYEDCCDDWKTVLDKIVNGLEEYASSGLAKEGVIHGDPVFSNVIITPDDGLKMLDMRGKQGNILTIRGDIMYDYAKTYQSICGYDFVLLNRPRCETYINDMRHIADIELKKRFGEEGLRYLRIVTASLYFSLIPLHNDKLKIKKYFELCKDVLNLISE